MAGLLGAFGMQSPVPISDDTRMKLLAVGTGLLSGQTGAQQAANAGMNLIPLYAQQQQQQKLIDEQNKTLQYFDRVNPQLAAQVRAGMPVADAWRMQAEAQKPKTPNLMAVNGLIYNKDSGQWIQPPEGMGTAKLTDDQREYDQAKQQGFTGTFMDYQIKMKEAGRNQVNIDTGAKLPSGFRWIDPKQQEKGVEPIPGGPGEQIPGELAARVGMAESFQKQLPEIKRKVQGGSVTGAFDRGVAGWFDSSEGANTYRQIQSGADALMRLLTGAGMNQAEAAAYAQRYLPSYTDSAESAAAKLDQLSQELESAKSMAMRGRGAAQPQATRQGTTSTGRTWKVVE